MDALCTFTFSQALKGETIALFSRKGLIRPGRLALSNGCTESRYNSSTFTMEFSARPIASEAYEGPERESSHEYTLTI
jgi:hypothetical protein